MPGVVGIDTTLFDLAGEPRSAVVLILGVPTAFLSLILAQEYDLDRELIACSIVLTTVRRLFAVSLWLFLFGQL